MSDTDDKQTLIDLYEILQTLADLCEILIVKNLKEVHRCPEKCPREKSPRKNAPEKIALRKITPRK